MTRSVILTLWRVGESRASLSCMKKGVVSGVGGRTDIVSTR